MFPNAEHGMWEFVVAPDGTRVSTRQPEGYFRMLVDFARDGRLLGAYGADLISDTERGKWTGEKLKDQTTLAISSS